ncbi:MAG: ATPase, T2SS/T4P/T4SS family [Chloroflexales bacterium]
MTHPPPWFSLEPELWLTPSPVADPDATASAAPPPFALAAALRLLGERGGWASALSPQESWVRTIGEICPYPADEAAFGAYPTFGPLDRLLRDEQITDIHPNGPGREVLVRHAGSALEWRTGEPWHPAWLPWLIGQCARRGSGQHGHLQLSGTADATGPGRAPCRLRYTIMQPPICLHGPALTLRVLRPGAFSLDRLVAQAMLPPDIAALLSGCVEAGINLVIAGTPGTGKTTLLRALLDQEPLAETRLICIEDVPELALASPYTVQLTASRALAMLALVYAAQRMNPARIVLGEVRGAEAYALLAAMRSGSPILTTVHGLSATNALDAFIGMALEAPEARGSVDLVRMNLNAQPLLIVALGRMQGQRRVSEIAELLPTGSAQHPLLQPRWRWDGATDSWLVVSPPSEGLLAQIRAAAHPATLAAWDTAQEGIRS